MRLMPTVELPRLRIPVAGVDERPVSGKFCARLRAASLADTGFFDSISLKIRSSSITINSAKNMALLI